MTTMYRGPARLGYCFSALVVALIGPIQLRGADDLLRVEVSRFKLRAAVQVSGPTVRLADVLVGDGADVRILAQIGERPLGGDDLAVGGRTQVTHAQVSQQLQQAGVNLSRVLVSGSLTCQVTRAAPAPNATSPFSPAAPPPSVASGASTGGSARIAGGPAGTGALLDVIRSHVANSLAGLGGTPQIEFERTADEFLSLTTPPFEFQVRGTNESGLGLREMSVIIRRDGRVQRSVRIAANVRLVKRVLVAARPLNVGGIVRADDLTSEERIFERAGDVGVDSADQLIGKQVRRYVPVAGMVTVNDVKSVDLVKRSRPVTVVGNGGNVSIRITGIALDSGDVGDAVRVRLGEGRTDRRVLRGVVTGLGTVRLEGAAE